MGFQPIQCSAYGPRGDVAASAFFRAQAVNKLPTRVGVVTAIDRFGRPPTLTVDGRRMKYLDSAALAKVGDRVLWQPCGDAPYVIGLLVATPTPTVEQTTDCFYTGQAAADYPAIRFRQWQGSSDQSGNATWTTDLDPANVAWAHTISPQYTSMSRQIARPTVVRSDGTIEVSEMASGKPFRTVVIEVCPSVPAATPVYRWVATGQNTASDEHGYAHPRWAVRSIVDNLPGNGQRSAGGSPGAADQILAVHGRVMIDGDSHDLSRYSSLDFSDGSAWRVHADGSVQGSSSIGGNQIRLSWFETPTVRHDVADPDDLYVDYLGVDKIGEMPLFEIIEMSTVFGSTGRVKEDIVFTNGEHRVNMVTGYTTDDLKSVAAEMYSESENVWQFADPPRSGAIRGQTVQGMALVMRGADLAQRITDM